MINPNVERLGIAFLDYFFAQHGWIFREQPTLDYGIDAHAEIVEGAYPSGKLIAIQSKSGLSFFEKPNENSFQFYPEEKHVQYWLRHYLPVILVLYHPEQKQAYWQIVIEENVVRTGTGKGWKIYVPKDNNFSNAADCLKKFSSLFESHIKKIVYKAIGRGTNPEVIESLRKAITALAQGQTHATPSQMDAAFAALRKGDFSLALSHFETEAERFEKEAKKGAEIQRNIGVLAFLNDTKKSLKAYSRATQLDPDNAEGWNQLGNLLVRIGEMEKAIKAYQIVWRLGQEHEDPEGIAAAYGNLGNVYKTRGDLDKAVEYYNKALQIDESLGCKEGMANAYSNIGIVYATRGNLDKAVEYVNKSLKINESLERKEGMVANYCNLGIVYRMRDDFDKVVEYYNKALQISKILGDKEKIAAVYCNLGNVFRARNDVDKAVEYYNEALQIEESLGHNEGMAANYGNLGNMYRMRGDFDNALEYYHKSLKIEESLERKEGIASDYSNLAALYETKKDYKKAREYWEKSLALYKVLSMPEAQQVQGWLDELPR